VGGPEAGSAFPVSEVGALALVPVLSEFGCGADEHHPAVVEHDHSAGDAERPVDVLLDEAIAVPSSARPATNNPDRLTRGTERPNKKWALAT